MSLDQWLYSGEDDDNQNDDSYGDYGGGAQPPLHFHHHHQQEAGSRASSYVAEKRQSFSYTAPRQPQQPAIFLAPPPPPPPPAPVPGMMIRMSSSYPRPEPQLNLSASSAGSTSAAPPRSPSPAHSNDHHHHLHKPVEAAATRRLGYMENTNSSNLRRVSEVDVRRPSATASSFTAFSAPAPPQPATTTSLGVTAARRASAASVLAGTDAKMVLERKLQEALDREKHQQSQITELKRKMAGLEERVRVVRNEKRRVEKRHGETLEARVLAAVQRVVQDRECDSELKDKISDAVAHAVAQTLLGAAEGKAIVAPPRRAPPSAGTPSSALVTLSNV